MLRIHFYTTRQGKAKGERKEEKGWDRKRKDRTGRERMGQEEKGWDRNRKDRTGRERIGQEEQECDRRRG